MKLFYFIIIFIFTIICPAQNSDIKEHLEASFKNHDNALKEIEYAIPKLEDCAKTHSIDVIHRNASDANRHLSLARKMIGHAKDRVNQAEKEASKINCSKVQDQARDSKNYFYDAERDLASACSTLYQIKYNKNNLSLLNQNISDAENDINTTLKKMTEAFYKLGNALGLNEECN